MKTAAALKTPDDFIAAGHTPMMAQYMAVKNAHADALVMYRMGDFYELFFDDALVASRILDITLTKRGKTDGADIPMCGVPVHALDPYLARLIRSGHRVAICEQTETPDQAKKRGGHKALVTRDVIRIVTPATLTEDTLLNARAANYLAALTLTRGDLSLAWLDLSTGAVWCETVAANALSAALARLDPAELLINQRVMEDDALKATLDPYAKISVIQGASLFDPDNAATKLRATYNVGTLDAYGSFSAGDIAAIGALIDYVERTQKSGVTHLRPPQRINSGDILMIDPATRRNLELNTTLSGMREGSLLATVDQTVTAAGARMLQTRLTAPLCDRVTITARLDQITAFVDEPPAREKIRAHLQETPDMERAFSRLSLGRGAPRDLAAIRGAMIAARRIHGVFSSIPPALVAPFAAIAPEAATDALADELTKALADELPTLLNDGNFIRAGFNPDLDHARGLRDNGRKMIVALQQTCIDLSGVDTLKIAHNNILGYYIEVSAKKAEALFAKPETFIHRQTMANAIRFTTTELAKLERDLMAAASRSLALEMEIFGQLRDQVLSVHPQLSEIADALATLDVAAALAVLAVEQDYTRPTLTNDDTFIVTQGRHPVVENALKSRGQHFIANDADVCAGRNLWLLTGPNMAGKSTFLRQNAIIVLLAQMGSYVPAASATIGVVDKLFSRVGAADDLAQGRSTFMVEMVETAAILNQATSKSFVILDEIGRGTSTFDGLSIAWATLEYLHDAVKCRALFATHYHELTLLQSRLPRLYGATMDVQEWQGDIVFLHAVRSGNADRSYGIHVAKLAGLPGAVTSRAETILRNLEAGDQADSVTRLAADLPLFTHTPAPVIQQKPHPVIAQLQSLNADELSPRDALELIYRFKDKL